MAGELAAAVCRVMQAVRYVPETGKNKFHGYSYASDEDLLSVLQPAMAENGLCIVPSGVRVATVEHSPDAKNKAQWRTELVMTYTMMHTSGETQTLESAGCGIDGEDKGTYKATTGALKYVLRQTFLVPTGQDPERDRPPATPNRVAEERKPKPPKDDSPFPDRDPPEGLRTAEPLEQKLKPRETGAEKAARQDAHDAKWDRDRAGFMGQLAKLEFGYDEVVEFQAWRAKKHAPDMMVGGVPLGRPSQVGNAGRHALLKFLGTSQGADVYAGFLSDREKKGAA